MQVILDTNALSAWLDGDPEIGPALRASSLLLLSPIVLGEYRFGIKASRHCKSYEERLALIADEVPILIMDEGTANHYSDIRQELKSQGKLIPWHNIWIAAQARQHGIAILSRDTHFDSVQGMNRIGW